MATRRTATRKRVTRKPARRIRQSDVLDAAARATMRLMNNKRRRIPATAPRNVRRRRVEQSTGTGEVSKLTRRWGRVPRPTLANAWKELRTSTDKLYYRFQGMTDYAAAQGFYPLDRPVTGTIPTLGAEQFFPCYMADVTCLNANGLASLPQPVLWRLKATYGGAGVQPTYTFVPQSSLGPDGNLSTFGSWTVENQPDASIIALQPSAQNNRRDIFSWLDARLICTGSTVQPTEFDISFIQLNADYLHPGTIPKSTDYDIKTADKAQTAARNTFYETLMYQYCSNPINVQNPLKRRDYKVLHNIHFTLQAKQTTEAQEEAHFKIVKVFQWFNRLQRYDWLQGTFNSLPTSLGTLAEGFQQTTGTALSALPPPRARIYMLLRATCQTPGTSGVVNPSFDLMLRKCHLVQV